MTTGADILLAADFRCEWERVELLAQRLLRTREGRESTAEEVGRLQSLQHQVEAGRRAGIWERLPFGPLSTMEYDILACVMAPEAEPRLGWLFQALQPGLPQPYPTPALLQELLALEGSEATEFHAALAEESPLQRERLIQHDNGDLYQPIRPGAEVTARLLGRSLPERIPPGALPVRQRASWEDLVLPPEQITMLHEWLLWIRHRGTVVEKWGGIGTGGPIALFAGSSGTGKTFAATVLAAELNWPLYRVDLGKLVSKYIGETEKNLNRLFDAAHGQPMVLQFDEADSLFSKRGEVKEARDRYANMEVSHLLARIESHQGPCILTTNLRGQLDDAFARRFQMVIEFPRPDAEARALLWERLLPPRAPREPDVDTGLLGRAVNLTGGGIRNAALHSAYLAAGAGRPISLTYVAVAVWRELAKGSHEYSRSDLGPLAEFLPEAP